MQLTPDVAVPDELIEASRAGRLVLFVGAGASANEPAGLPTFRGLAQQLAALLGEPYDGDTDPDQFLGDLAGKHGAMKELLRSVIDSPHARPNANHHAIAALAHAAGARIVTTNYDELIQRAATADGVDLGERYDAPALPLGRDFAGIVYLHGAVSQPSARFVVTDQDFGQAYLTDGWARRFVHDLYLHWTVLFVGYSHDDVVMSYLARGLPRDTKRYALTHQPEHGRWRRLDVVPVPYPHSPDHGAIAPALEAWASLMRMGQLDHHARVKTLAAGVPPKEPHESDYLAFALTTPAGARGFAEVARSEEWLPWIETQPIFARIFAAGRCEDDASRTLARWFVDAFVAQPDRSRSALGCIARMGPEASDDLLDHLELAARDIAKRSPAEVRRWEAVRLAALRRHPSAAANVTFNPYFSPLSGHQLMPTLRRVLASRLVLVESTPWFHDDEEIKTTRVTFDVEWAIDEHALGELLKAVTTDPSACRTDVLAILEQALADRYELMDAVAPEGYFDSWSFGRSAIEAHPQDQYGDHIGSLIDALRDLGVEESPHDHRLIARWLTSGHALFRRLGLHLLVESSMESADVRLHALLEADVLYDLDVRHEVFRALRQLGPSLGTESRAALLAALVDDDGTNESLAAFDDHLQRRVRFDRLEWLTRHVDDWQELKDELADLVADEPIAAREHPDFGQWMSSGVWGGQAPMRPEDFAEKVRDSGAADAVAYLAEVEPEERAFGEPDFDDAVRMVQDATALDPKIGLELLPEVRAAAFARHEEFIPAIVQGWAASTPEADLIPAIMDAISALSVDEDLAHPIGELAKQAARAWDDILNQPARARFDELAQRLWARHAAAFDGSGWSDVQMQALNTWPGHLAQYWLFRISNRWRQEGDDWQGLSTAERGAIAAMIDLDAPARGPAVAMLMRDLQFLYAADSDFTVQRMLPVFGDPNGLGKLAFESYLYNPRAYPDLLDAGFWDILLGERGSLRPDEGDDRSELARRYWMVIAQLMAFSTATSIDHDATIARFAGSPDKHELACLVHAIASALDDLVPAKQDVVWDGWLGAAMRDRCNAAPGLQSQAERAAWGDLALSLLRPEAIQLATAAPGPLTSATRFDEMPEAVIASHSDQLVRLAIERVEVTTTLDWHATHELSALVEQVRGTASDAAVRELAELAVQRGVEGALRWAE
jgi:hypothetical protein